jgi:F-type H+-transporting ATPase subunit alpha
LQAVLTQSAHHPLSLSGEIAILLALVEGFLDDVPVAEIPTFESHLIARLEVECPTICAAIEHTGKLTDEARRTLLEVVATCRRDWFEGRCDEKDDHGHRAAR